MSRLCNVFIAVAILRIVQLITHVAQKKPLIYKRNVSYNNNLLYNVVTDKNVSSYISCLQLYALLYWNIQNLTW